MWYNAWWHHPLEIWEGERHLEFVMIYSNFFYFECKYLWNGWRYWQAVNGIINYNLSRIEQKNC